MDTKIVKAFLTAANAGSISVAGGLLDLPQSVVSRRIKELETRCGARLLHRNGHGVRLTTEGALLYKRIAPLLTQFMTAIDSVADVGRIPAGLVTVGMSPSIVIAIAPPLIAEMQKDYPQIQLNIVTGYSGHVHEWLMQARIDIGIFRAMRSTPRLPTEDLGSTGIVLAASPQFVFPRSILRKQISFKALNNVPIIVPTKTHSLRRQLDAAAIKAGISLNIVHSIDDLSLVKALVADGKAATILSPFAVKREVEAGLLTVRRIVNPSLLTRSVLATAHNRPTTSATKLVSQMLKSTCAMVLADLESE